MKQALASGVGNQGAVHRRLSGSHEEKGAERDKPTKKHGLAFVFHLQKPAGMPQIVVQRISYAEIKEAQEYYGDLQHAFAFHDDLLSAKATCVPHGGLFFLKIPFSWAGLFYCRSGYRPSWRRIRNGLVSVHSSFIFPSTTRKMLIPRPSAFFPVAFRPFPTPVFVPCPLHNPVLRKQ
jgi:hypothetical protein